MADARALLRQQRASRRIEHPHATYTDAGKLLCTLCREPVKAEALWDGHLAGDKHRRRLNAAGAPERSQTAGAAKRKHSDDGGGDDDAVRRKRSRPNLGITTGADRQGNEAKDGIKEALTPPDLVRRASTTPSQGVELQIPSRPATPSRRDTSSAPSRPSTSRQPSNGTPAPPPPPPQKHDVDETEWAAFEADIAAESAPYADDAVISAPAMTAEESAAAAAAAAAEPKAQADVDLEAEREEATRAMEDEFADMHELEERVRRLKEKREALRQRGSHGPDAADKPPATPGKENLQGPAVADTDDDEDPDDWEDGFRFRAS